MSDITVLSTAAMKKQLEQEFHGLVFLKSSKT